MQGIHPCSGSPEKRRKVEARPSQPVALESTTASGASVHGDCHVQEQLPSVEVAFCPPELIRFKYMQTARGAPVVPSQRALEAARRLLSEAEVTELDQPTGATWSVLPIVTPDGLVKHFVQLSCLDEGVEIRGKTWNSGKKHSRCQEE